MSLIVNPSLAAVIGADGEIFTLRLLKADFNEEETHLLAALHEADYPGYSPLHPIPWLTERQLENGNVVSTTDQLTFKCTGDSNPQDIYGWCLTGAGGDGPNTVRYQVKFAGPYQMRRSGAIIPFKVSVAVFRGPDNA